MLCEYCKKNPVTTHIKAIINGEPTEYSLCAECAQKFGYGSLLTNLGYNFGGLLGEFFSEPEMSDLSETVHCKFCGASFDDIIHTGKVGCAQCYKTFSDRLIPLIQHIHGNTKHIGKIPGGNMLQKRPNEQLSVMKRELREAIDTENFEHAADLRDKIKEIERELKHD